MRKLFVPLILITILSLIYINSDKITDTITPILLNQPKLVIEESNTYARDYQFYYLENNQDYVPYSNQDLLNIFYSILNNGWNEFTFYCPKEYIDCIKDMKVISENEVLLTNINNYVHPYNSFSNIKTTYDTSGEITIQVKKLYNQEEINQINQIVDDLINQKINSNMTDREKIKIIHDYIINNTSYDLVRSETGSSQYKSNIAYGPLIQSKGVCGGYSDAMAIFLNKFGIKNYKIASELHVWNGVYIDNQWLHLDLTWDDPVDSSGREHLIYKYFLIPTHELVALDTKNHDFDLLIYQEFK